MNAPLYKNPRDPQAHLNPLRRLDRAPGTWLSGGIAALIFWAGSLGNFGVLQAQTPAELAFFEEKVRPLLIEHCYECHSAQSQKLKGQFLVDSRDGIRRGGESRQASVVPGDVSASRLITAVRWTDPDLQMPPKKRLSTAQVATLEAWVKMGAPDPREADPTTAKRRPMTPEEAKEYWAFKPLQTPAIPSLKPAAEPTSSEPRTALDRFVLSRLQSEGLSLSPQAERRVLLRRAAFALTGLPPSPSDIDLLERDSSPESLSRAIDRLLASPHYGERWGRHWLDVARFAESSGFEHDYDRPTAWHYRDFVIRALNDDMPYNQFVQWQLAGDELEPNNPIALMATGFLGAGVFPTQITANEVERVRYDALDDMVTTTGVAFLGLSVGCARCHDHKFDPIASRDYYRLLSTFTTTVRSEVDLDLNPEANAHQLRRWEGEHAERNAALKDYETTSLESAFQEWVSHPANRPELPPWLILEFTEAKSIGGATLTPQTDGSLLASGKNPDFDTYHLTARVPAGEWSALRVEALSHASFTKGGPGRADNGNFALSDLHVVVRPVGNNQPTNVVRLTQPKATFEQKGLPVASVIDTEKKTGWAIDPRFGKDHAASFEFAEPTRSDVEMDWVITLKFEVNNRHAIGRPRLSLSGRAYEGLASSPFKAPALELVGKPMRRALDAAQAWTTPVSQRTPAQMEALRQWHRWLDSGWRARSEAVSASLAAKPRPELTKVLVATEGLPAVRMHTQGADFFEKTFFLRRGDVNQKQDAVPAGFLPVLMRQPETRWVEPPPTGWRTSYRRRSLARWLTDLHDGAGALLARVMVNRVWALHFGRGIVTTPNDFGIQGELPTHPELLEWLAQEFVRSNWSMKALHRLILNSAVWQQTSSQTAREAAMVPRMAQAAQVDPSNVLLWHYPRKRLEAEVIRDHVLAASGQLDRRMGGAGTLDENHLRRSVYFMVKRSQLSRSLQLFDAPDAVLSAANRPATITAPQALMFLNSPFVRQRAVDFARRLLPEYAVSAERAVRQGYELSVGRPPTATELTDATTFLEQQAAAYRDDVALNALKVREYALIDLCQVLFGLNEFVYIE